MLNEIDPLKRKGSAVSDLQSDNETPSPEEIDIMETIFPKTIKQLQSGIVGEEHYNTQSQGQNRLVKNNGTNSLMVKKPITWSRYLYVEFRSSLVLILLFSLFSSEFFTNLLLRVSPFKSYLGVILTKAILFAVIFWIFQKLTLTTVSSNI